ncbi:TPA: DUF551 domain-containing protein [Escherichia coli]|nr:DUF551 domain-containing protein [Escherichia coli]
MTTITKERIELFIKNPLDNGLTRGEQMELARIALASLEAEPVAVNDDMAYAFHHALSDSSLGADEVEEIKAGLRAAFANVTIQPEPVVPDEIEPDDSNTFDYVDGWNACRAAMLQGAEKAESPTTMQTAPALDSSPKISESPVSNSPVIPDYLSTVCAEAYQVVGVMADALGVFGDAAVQKVLDNLSQQKLVHRDVLPFSLPVTPDGWISCSERMPPQDDWILIYSKHGEYMAGQVQGEYVELSDGTLSWLGNALFWMPLPEPLQEVK